MYPERQIVTSYRKFCFLCSCCPDFCSDASALRQQAIGDKESSDFVTISFLFCLFCECRHLAMGMGFVVQIGEPEDMPGPPPGTQFCGTVSKLMGPPVRNAFVSGGCAA